jgi:hypothetical protein
LVKINGFSSYTGPTLPPIAQPPAVIRSCKSAPTLTVPRATPSDVNAQIVSKPKREPSHPKDVDIFAECDDSHEEEEGHKTYWRGFVQ